MIQQTVTYVYFNGKLMAVCLLYCLESDQVIAWIRPFNSEYEPVKML